MKPSRTPKTQGSALLATLIITMLLAVLIGSVLPMSLGNHRLSVQDSMNSTSFHLAEAGVEQAIFDLRQAGDPDLLATAGWTLSADEAYFTKVLTEADFPWGLDANRSFEIRLLMDNPMLKTKIAVVAEARVFRGESTTPESRRMVELELEVSHILGDGTESTGNGPFQGIIVRGKEGPGYVIISNGKATYRSYNSAYIGEGTYSPPNTANASDNITVGALHGVMQLGNGEIFGNVASSAEDPEAEGRVQIKNTNQISKGIVGNFYMEFPDINYPSVPSGEQKTFHNDQNSNPSVIGDADSNELQIFTANHYINMKQDMEVRGNVVIIADGINFNSGKIRVASGANLTFFSKNQFQLNDKYLEVNGNATIVANGDVNIHDVSIASNGSLHVYSKQNLQFQGKRVNIDGPPSNFALYTNSAGDINFNGNVAFSGVIYAPNAKINANGSPSAPFYGAVVAREFTNNGAGTFWYDEALKNFQMGGNPEEVSTEVVAYNFKSIQRYLLPRNTTEVHLVQGTDHSYDALVQTLFAY